MKQNQEELDVKIKAFNFEFESKALDRSSRFIHPEFMEAFQKNSVDFKKKVTILESDRLDLKFFMDDKPVTITPSLFEEDFNRAELKVRYQLSILPSTKIKTIIVKQEWVRHKSFWYVLPNLDSFLN